MPERADCDRPIYHAVLAVKTLRACKATCSARRAKRASLDGCAAACRSRAGNPPENHLGVRTMSESKTAALKYLRGTDVCIWMADEPVEGGWVAETFLRKEGSIYHLSAHYQEGMPTVEQLQRDAYMSGIRSPRPYHLQQKWDASCSACVFALFFHLCRSKERDPQVMINECLRVDPRFDWSLIETQAQWEGIEYPAVWDHAMIQQLCEALMQMWLPELAADIQRKFT
jgi:hypothetical protein